MTKNDIPSLKVMIVEDEYFLRELYKKLLPKEWEIEYFDNSRSASIQYNENSNFDLVITDLVMAPKNAEGLIFDIKYINPAQKIIVVSGFIGDLNLPEKFNVK